ncbi:MAG TPA: response regulator [Thermoanaerobaculia bacterium]
MKKDEQPRVLVVEDNDAIRVMLFTILRHQPLNVDTASTADEAMAHVLECDYALILIDMDLPHRTAESFLREFKAKRPEATSFVIAFRDPRNQPFIDSTVVVAALNKPIEIDTMAEVVRECAFLVPKPEEPLPCGKSPESQLYGRAERNSYIAN